MRNCLQFSIKCRCKLNICTFTCVSHIMCVPIEDVDFSRSRPRTSCLDDCGMPSGHANVAYFYLGWAIPYFFQYYVWLSAKRRNGELVSGRDLHAQVSMD